MSPVWHALGRYQAVVIPGAVALALTVGLLVHMHGAAASTGSAAPVVGREMDAAFTALVDGRGSAAREADFAGHYRLVLFGFMSCPDVCPTALAGVHLALESIGPAARLVRPVFITVDPDRDSAAALAAYLQAFDARIIGYRGSAGATAAVARHYGVRYAKRILDPRAGTYVVEHTASAFLVDPEGRLVAVIPAARGSRALAAALREALATRPRSSTGAFDPLSVAGTG